MRIQYVSDLHLEFYEKLAAIPRIDVVGDVLVLAGDVGYPTKPLFWKFMEEQSRRFKNIIYVPGNHEYYHTNAAIEKHRLLTIDEMDELIRSELRRRCLTNIYMLQNDVCIIDGVRFIGSTLWSYIDENMKYEIVSMMNDYARIFIGHNFLERGSDNGAASAALDRDDAVGLHRLTVGEVNRRSAVDSAYIAEQLQQPAGGSSKTVVVTHHLPSMEMIDAKYAGSAINSAFASNILHTLSVKPDVWICGHSHTAAMKEIEGVVCVMNPVGYPGENNDFNTGQYIDI